MLKKIFSIIKFTLAVLFLPVIIAVTKGLFIEMQVLKELRQDFLLGVVFYCILNLFYYPLEAFYQFGQRVFGDIFRFSSAAVSVLPLIIPIYTTLLLVIHYIILSVFDYNGLQSYFVFFIGFTLAMHIVMTAHDLYDEDNGQIKAHYLFYFSLIYIFNITLFVILLDFNFANVKFISFINYVYSHAESIYFWAYRLLI